MQSRCNYMIYDECMYVGFADQCNTMHLSIVPMPPTFVFLPLPVPLCLDNVNARFPVMPVFVLFQSRLLFIHAKKPISENSGCHFVT